MSFSLKSIQSSVDMALVGFRWMGSSFTVPGFWSAFRDWAAERTNVSREVCEMALAHVLRDKVEAAYRRGDLFVKRQSLMKTCAALVEEEEAPCGRCGQASRCVASRRFSQSDSTWAVPCGLSLRPRHARWPQQPRCGAHGAQDRRSGVVEKYRADLIGKTVAELVQLAEAEKSKVGSEANSLKQARFFHKPRAGADEFCLTDAFVSGAERLWRDHRAAS